MPRDRRPPEQLTRRQLHARIVRRHLEVIRECRQAIINGEYFNGLPQMVGETPIDLEDFRVTLHETIESLNAFLKENLCPPN